MMAYVGQTRSLALIAELENHGIGECVVCGELPARRSRFFHDPGAYRDWRAGQPFNVCRWDRDMRWMSYRGIVPDFVPDIVAGGLASLEWSAFWRDTVPEEFRAYLGARRDDGGGRGPSLDALSRDLRRRIAPLEAGDRRPVGRAGASAWPGVSHRPRWGPRPAFTGRARSVRPASILPCRCALASTWMRFWPRLDPSGMPPPRTAQGPRE